MNYLLDTHTFLWFNNGSPELSIASKELIINPENEIFMSMASLWEISIKNALGKLVLKKGYEAVLEDVVKNSIEILNINFEHTLKQNRLPFHHRDPFDRMIVSQAIVENMSLISKDRIFDLYLENLSLARIW